ncbi:MAG: dihydroorotase [Clostridiales bacterium]|nr:dihydroorotase [Clostridiales bacterium]
MRVLIKNGYILDPASNKEGIYDMLIDGDRIKEVQKNINTQVDKVIDATGMYVMPGFIDLHVHLREPGYEYKETIATGTRSAASGGFTTVCPMPNTKPVIDSKERVEEFLNRVEKDSLINVLPVGSVTIGQVGEELADIKAMTEAGIVGISEDGKSVMNPALYRKGMKLAKEAGAIVFAHCEDMDLVEGGVINAGDKAKELGLPGISNSVEDVIAARDVILAKETGAKLHLCHISTKDSVTILKSAKEEGILVTGEVCPHHFAMSDDEIPCDDANYKMNPPLRSKEDIEALIKGLKEGIIDAIATDHAPHSQEEKARSFREAPFGIVGFETAFALTMTHLVKPGHLSPMEMVEKMSLNPAKILGIDKGSLAEGKIADIVIASPDEEYTIDAASFHSKGKNTPFNGKKVVGKVKTTIVAGKVVFENEKFV